MILIVDGHDFNYGMEKLCRVFFPYEKITVTTDVCAREEITAYTGSTEAGLSVWLQIGERREEARRTALSETPKKERERLLAVLLFGLLSRLCENLPQWGILTGVRPVKLLRQLAEELGEAGADEHFREKLLVSPPKTEKTKSVLHAQAALLPCVTEDSFGLYVGIPFCPTRCAYCSFVSSSVEKSAKLIPAYLDCLHEELRATAALAKSRGLRLLSVYVGGGTPTTLSAEQLAALLHTINNNFDLSFCREYTVEAGRPDTITRGRLRALLGGGVTRVSINPQSFNDRVLDAIGRRHSAAQTLEAFALARELGFDDINMDLIAGLPEDTPESFKSSLDQALALRPENLTLHTLALKRASQLALAGGHHDENAAEMLAFADPALAAAGYRPYYLYRQSRMAGNLENTGWALPGRAGLYNFCVMDECQTILACGAGAATKILNRRGGLTRLYNFKFPNEYIGRFKEILTRKEQVNRIYDNFEP